MIITLKRTGSKLNCPRMKEKPYQERENGQPYPPSAKLCQEKYTSHYLEKSSTRPIKEKI
uniref:Uncharacterized protein n=1 Tax=Rhizophora mucronata TaxID=61149 RepID=A0A2P2QTX8_RHIMU